MSHHAYSFALRIEAYTRCLVLLECSLHTDTPPRLARAGGIDC